MTDLKFELLGTLYNNPLQLHGYDDLRKPKSEKHVEIKAALDWLIDEGYISRVLTGLAYCEITNKGREAYEQEQIHRNDISKEYSHFKLNLWLNIVSLFIAIGAAVISLIELLCK